MMRFRQRTHRRNDIFIKVGLVGVTLLVMAGVAKCVHYIATYEETKRVVIEDRWWNFTLAVKYDDYECSVSIDPNDNSITQDCGWETYTRCKSNNTGRDLPPMRPEPACSLRAGDYTRDSVSYYVQYRVEDTSTFANAHIGKEKWDRLEPGVRKTIVLDFFDNIKLIKE
jgi:hypothetical protein